MERETGFEPATPSLEGSCSSQLSYSRVYLEERGSRNDSPGRLRFQPARRRRAGGEGRIRTSEGMSQQIYSLPRLAASVPLRLKSAHASLASGLPSQASRTRNAHNLLIDARDLNESFACRDVCEVCWRSWRGDSNP